MCVQIKKIFINGSVMMLLAGGASPGFGHG
jgi:hypothetical protein